MELIWTLDYNLHSNYQTKTVVIDKKCWWNTASNLRCLSCRSVWTNFPKSCPSSWRLRGWVRLSWSISTLIIVQYVAVWSDKAAEAHCWMRYFWHLAVACALCDRSVSACLPFRKWLRPHRSQWSWSCRTLSKSEWAALFAACNLRLSLGHLPQTESLCCVSAKR